MDAVPIQNHAVVVIFHESLNLSFANACAVKKLYTITLLRLSRFKLSIKKITVYLVQYDRSIPFNVPDRSPFLTVFDRSRPFLTVPERS